MPHQPEQNFGLTRVVPMCFRNELDIRPDGLPNFCKWSLLNTFDPQ